MTLSGILLYTSLMNKICPFQHFLHEVYKTFNIFTVISRLIAAAIILKLTENTGKFLDRLFDRVEAISPTPIYLVPLERS